MADRTTICSPIEVLTLLGKAGTATTAELGLLNLIQPGVEATVQSFLGWNVIQRTYTHLLPDTDLFEISQNDLGLPIDVVNNRISYSFPGPPVILQTPEIPLRSISSLYADYSALGGQGGGGTIDFPANTLQVQGTDYFIDFTAPDSGNPMTGICWTGHVRRWIGVWPARQRCIKVTYTAGFTADEIDGATAIGYRRVADVKFATILAIAAAFRSASAWNDRAGSLTGGSGPIVSERLGDAAFTYNETALAQVAGMTSVLPMEVQAKLRKHRRVQR